MRPQTWKTWKRNTAQQVVVVMVVERGLTYQMSAMRVTTQLQWPTNKLLFFFCLRLGFSHHPDQWRYDNNSVADIFFVLFFTFFLETEKKGTNEIPDTIQTPNSSYQMSRAPIIQRCSKKMSWGGIKRKRINANAVQISRIYTVLKIFPKIESFENFLKWSRDPSSLKIPEIVIRNKSVSGI